MIRPHYRDIRYDTIYRAITTNISQASMLLLGLIPISDTE